MTTKIPARPAAARPTWTVEQFVEDANVSKALLYKLEPELWPHSAKIGRRRVIFEHPAAWLARLAEAQRAAAVA